MPATELGSHAIRAALERAQVSPEEVDEVLLGCVLQAGLGQNAARQAAMGAGLPVEVPATTVNMLCGSGLKAVTLAAQIIRAGDADIIVAGGMENMTRAPYLVPSGRFGARMGDTQMIDSMVHDGLMDAFEHVHMGITAENVAEDYGITREQQDEFAARASRRPNAPSRTGIFKEEIVPIEVPQKKGETRLVDNDEHPRAGTTTGDAGQAAHGVPQGWRDRHRRQRLRLNDGASAIVVMSQRMAAGARPRAARRGRELRVGRSRAPRSWGSARSRRRARRSRRSASGSRTSTSSSSTRPSRRSRSPSARSSGYARTASNPHGGAIALGHPIGASGGRILVTLLHEMKRERLDARRRDAVRGRRTGTGRRASATAANGASTARSIVGRPLLLTSRVPRARDRRASGAPAAHPCDRGRARAARLARL